MSTDSTSASETKIHNIQTLRFIAAFWVLFGHLLMEAKKYGLLEGPVFQLIYFFPWGTGVDIFFVISGFIICHVSRTIDPSHWGVADFMIKRLIRIAPIYWFYTGAMLAAMLLFSHMVSSNQIALDHVLASLFFIPWPNPDSQALRPVLGQGWTLNYEMMFYLVVALGLYFPGAMRKYFISLTIIVLFVTGLLLRDVHYAFGFFGSGIILEFVCGIWLYEFYVRTRLFSWPLSLSLVVLSCVLLGLGEFYAPQDDMRFISRGIPSLLFAAGIIFSADLHNLGGKLQRTLTLLGDSSYSLYLSHPFVLVPLAAIFKKLAIASPLLYVFAGLVLCLFVSIISYLLIEKRTLSFLRKNLRLDSRPKPQPETQ